MGWFVGSVTTKLVSGFPQNLDGGPEQTPLNFSAKLVESFLLILYWIRMAGVYNLSGNKRGLLDLGGGMLTALVWLGLCLLRRDCTNE